jgi:ligand-binding sensor domain-containing protein
MVFQRVANPVLQQYNIRHLSTDKEGKLWLSTDNGLLCYDGNDVKVFKHDNNDPSSIRSNNILKSCSDSKGNVYFIDDVYPGNLGVINGKTGRSAVLQIALNGEHTRMMATPFPYSDVLIDDENESLWIACYYIGFQHYNLKTARTDNYYLHDEYSGKNSVYTIRKSVSDKNLLWLGTEDGIYSFNKNTKQLKRNFRCANPADSSVGDLHVTNIGVYNRDSIWFSIPGKGIGCYDTKTGYYKIFPLSKSQLENTNDISTIQIQRKSNNELFVATKHSLPAVFNTSTHEYNFSSFTSQDLPSVLLNYFLLDSANNFWCVLYNKLFQAHSAKNKFETTRLNTKGDNTGFDNAFKTIIWDEKHKVYYAAFEKGTTVFVLDTNFKIAGTIPVVCAKNKNDTSRFPEIYDLALDKKGRLWLSANTLCIYDRNSQKIVRAEEIYPLLAFKNHFQNLVIRGNYMYLQPLDFRSRAIYRIDLNSVAADSIVLPDEIAKDKNYEDQPVKLLNYLSIDKAGRNAYFGYSKYSFLGYTDCLVQLNLRSKKARRVTFIEGVEHNELSNLFNYALDDSNRIWVEMQDGIKIFDPDDLHLVTNIEPEAERFSARLLNLEGSGIMCRLFSQGIMLYNYRNNSRIHLTLNDGLASYMNSTITYSNKTLFTGASNYFQYIPLTSVTGKENTIRKCYLSSIQLFNQTLQTDTLPENLRVLEMTHDKNFITLTFSSIEFERPERLEYRYKMDGIDKDWVYVNHLNRTISYNDLEPGHYVFHASVRNADRSWSTEGVNLAVSIIPAWWQTDLFKILSVLATVALAYFLVRWRIRAVRKQEQLKVSYEKELLELEAKALRAQMNPHFIFNCMNSIKSLIQKGEQEKSILYLTTFSKLIRTVFQNSDKREITLYDEIETCRLYTELESMRFGKKFSHEFNIDDKLDLKSIMVPALILQPFIENAIWHGIMSKEDGGFVSVTVNQTDHTILCIIDDNGIGREISQKNKFLSSDASHESKGEHLTQARLDLDNLLNQRNASVRIIDKKDSSARSSGTTVILAFKEDQT